jgi:chromosome segregation ATPase
MEKEEQVAQKRSSYTEFSEVGYEAARKYSGDFTPKTLNSLPPFFTNSRGDLTEDVNSSSGSIGLPQVSLSQYQNLQEEVIALKKRILKDEDKTKFLKELLKVKEKQIDMLSKENERLKSDPNQLAHKKQILSLIEKLQTSEENSSTLKQEIFHLKAEIQKKDDTISSLQSSVNDFEDKDKKIEQVSFLLNFYIIKKYIMINFSI